MKNLLIIGAGGVGAAVAHKCAQNSHRFGDICLASRTIEKCNDIVDAIHKRRNLTDPERGFHTRWIDAMDSNSVADLIRHTSADIVINVGSPYCNMSILKACIVTGTDYIDTAVHETVDELNMPAPWYAHYEWRFRDACANSNVTAILGMGFDPGVVNVFCAHVVKHLLDEVHTIDILDVNGGDHGQYFATNFDPETNLREILEDVIYWENGQWKTVPCHSKSRSFDFPGMGEFKIFSMGHDEIHSLYKNIRADRIEFWMGFGERYLKVFDVLKNLGMLSNQPVNVEGVPVQPIKLLKSVLPDPASLAEGYTGKVCIGSLVKGIKDGSMREVFVYSTCDHKECFKDIGSQAISYTTGVPAVTAALLLAEGPWKTGTMVNAEELDPDPFLALMPQIGIDWSVREQ